MPKKTKSRKSKKGAATKSKAGGQKASLRLQTIKVHPRLAHAIASLKKVAPKELEDIRTLSSTEFANDGGSTGCWLSDTGGQQHCVNLPPAVCTSKGGISVPTKCPIT
jgi:hypothetical protein